MVTHRRRAAPRQPPYAVNSATTSRVGCPGGDSRTLDPHTLRARVPLSLFAPPPWRKAAAGLHSRSHKIDPHQETTMQRKASARWQGTVKEGAGTLSTQSGTLRDTPYSFVARFGDGKGTNPEELIAAAHAGCFTMALSFMLNNAGFTADAIDTEATLTFDQTGGAW